MRRSRLIMTDIGPVMLGMDELMTHTGRVMTAAGELAQSFFLAFTMTIFSAKTKKRLPRTNVQESFQILIKTQ